MTADERFMRRALELARVAMLEGAGPPFGSVVVRDGAIVGEGANRVVAEQDPTWHAEIAALRQAARLLGPDLAGCTLYATGEPCPMCAAALHFANVDALVFAAPADARVRWSGVRYRFGPAEYALPTLERPLPARQVLAAEAVALLEEYRRLTR